MADEDGRAARHEDRLRWSKDVIAGVWADRLSRLCAVIGGVSLWLTVSLTEPAFLLPLVGAAFGIWYLRGHRASAAALVDDDDLF